MKLVEHINFIVSFTTKLETTYFATKNNGQLFEEDSFFNILNARVNRIFNSLSLLLKSNPEQHEDFGLFVLLRVLLLDSLFVLYVFEQLQPDDINRAERLLNLSKVALSDGIKLHKGFIDRANGIGKISDAEHENMYNTIVEMNPTIIDSDETNYPDKLEFNNFKINGNEKFNATNLFDLLKNTDYKSDAWKLYELYYNYSKFDHFTIDGYKMSAHFTNDKKLQSVRKSVYLIIGQYLNYLQLLEYYNNVIDKGNKIDLDPLFSEYKNWLASITQPPE